MVFLFSVLSSCMISLPDLPSVFLLMQSIECLPFNYVSGYLKYFQLNNNEILGYDCLLIDEAQDYTPGYIFFLIH